MFTLVNLVAALVLTKIGAANNWKTYPAVPKTASINGFADPIKSALPACASDCADLSTENTPCPYWDTGCLCMMPQWAGLVGGCFALACSGSDVVMATSLAHSLCNKVGANLFIIPASVSTALSKAAGDGIVLASNSAAATVSQPTFLSNATSTFSTSSMASSSSNASLTLSKNLGFGNLNSHLLAVLLLPVFVLMA